MGSKLVSSVGKRQLQNMLELTLLVVNPPALFRPPTPRIWLHHQLQVWPRKSKCEFIPLVIGSQKDMLYNSGQEEIRRSLLGVPLGTISKLL